MKKTILKIVPVLFMIIFISGVAKADTLVNVSKKKPAPATGYSLFNNTLTFQVDKPAYVAGEIITPVIYYYPYGVSVGSSVTNEVNTLSLYTPDYNGTYEFTIPTLTSFKTPMTISPGNYTLYAYLSDTYRSASNTSMIYTVKNKSKFDLISFLGDMFIPKKAEACWANITTCDEFGNCTGGPTPICNGIGGSTPPSSPSTPGWPIVMNTPFTIVAGSPKIFSK